MWIRNISNRYKKPGNTVARWQTVSKRTYSKYEKIMCDRQSDVSNTARRVLGGLHPRPVPSSLYRM